MSIKIKEDHSKDAIHYLSGLGYEDYLKANKQEKNQLREELHVLRTAYPQLQSALRPLVLRLKVLDVEQLKQDLGEDGTIPVRLMLTELKKMVDAWDGKFAPSGDNLYDKTMAEMQQQLYEQQQRMYAQQTRSGRSSITPVAIPYKDLYK